MSNSIQRHATASNRIQRLSGFHVFFVPERMFVQYWDYLGPVCSLSNLSETLNCLSAWASWIAPGESTPNDTRFKQTQFFLIEMDFSKHTNFPSDISREFKLLTVQHRFGPRETPAKLLHCGENWGFLTCCWIFLLS